MKIHEKYIKRCIALAKNGLGTTYPNPLVGSVVVYHNRVIGEGWHRKAGGPHAEVVAINSVKEKELLKDATIYINLEPCSHYGKTPPCCDLIIASGIKKVVAGTADPFPEVSGRGFRKLREAGCTVTTGVLEAECRALNRRFFTFHTKKRPYVLLKWAESRDGFLGPVKVQGDVGQAKPEWVSNGYSRQRVHQWRSEEQAILAGTATVLLDNPRLNVRDWKGADPVRVVTDRQLCIPKAYAVWDGKVKTIFIAERSEDTDVKGAVIEQVDFSGEVAGQICEVLYRHGVQSVMVEGGAKTLQLFIAENVWDEARVITGTGLLKQGVKAPVLKKVAVHEERIGGDRLRVYVNGNG